MRGFPPLRKVSVRKDAKVFFASLHASRYNGGNPPPGSPVAYGGKPAYSTGSPQRAGLALRETQISI